MQNSVTYEFAVIRLVPKVEREEFINIGVILYSKRKKYLGIKYALDPIKIKALAPDLDPTEIEKYLAAWELICRGAPHGGYIGTLEQSLRFRWLVATRSSIIQSSKTHPGLCEEPEAVLERLFERFVS